MEHVINPSATSLVKGLILASHWGYDQTNVDFYIVTEVEGQFATIVEIVAPEKPTAPMFGIKSPVLPVMFKGGSIRRKMKGTYVSINSFSGAMPWSGQPEHVDHSH